MTYGTYGQQQNASAGMLVNTRPARWVSEYIARTSCCNVLNFERHETCNEQSLVLWLSLAATFLLSSTLATLNLTN